METPEIGDVVANKFGHVLAVGKVEDDGWILCFYQTDPTESYTKYKSEDLRLLSKTKGIKVGGEPFMDTIRRCLEASGRVVKTTKKREERDPEEVELLRGLSKEELREMLQKAKGEKRMKKGENDSKNEEDSSRKEGER